MRKINNYNIEKIRIFAAVCVIYIHASTFIYSSGEATFWNYYLMRRFSDVGVVFFFATTGYFLALNKSNDKIRKTIKMLFNTWVIAAISYFILFSSINFLKYLLLEESFISGIKELLKTVNLTNLITGRMFSGVTWYLPASIVALFVFSLYNKYKVSTTNIIRELQ